MCLTSCQQVVERPQHQSQWRAKFMAHVAEECCLRAVNLGQGLGSLLFGGVSASICNARGDLAGNKIDEPRITHVQRTEWIQPGDDHSRRLVLTLTRDR